jgi:hypothetical protein
MDVEYMGALVGEFDELDERLEVDECRAEGMLKKECKLDW